MSEEDALRATTALHAATRVVESEMQAQKTELSDKDAIKVAIADFAERGGWGSLAH